MKRFYCNTLIALFMVSIWGYATAASAQNYADTVLADNPVAYYRFSEASGTTALDSSPYGNNATYRNGVQFDQPSLYGLGLPVSSLGFDGVSAHVSAFGLNQIGANRFNALSFTLETWVNTTRDSLTGTAAWHGNGLIWSDISGLSNDFTLAALNNRVSFSIRDEAYTIIGNTVINDGRWHHIVATRAIIGASSTVTLWVDGVLDVTRTVPNASPLRANRDIVLGGNPLDRRYFDGYMDEVALYNTVLSPDQIQRHYQIGTVPMAEVTVVGTVSLEGYSVQKGHVFYPKGIPLFFRFQPVNGGQPFSRTLYLGADGTFTLNDIPAQPYQVWIKGDKWLAKSVPIEITKGRASTIKALLLAGDANNDNFVDVLDLDVLISAFGSKVNAKEWREGADFNGDGAVDVLDLDLLLRNFDTPGDF